MITYSYESQDIHLHSKDYQEKSAVKKNLVRFSLHVVDEFTSYGCRKRRLARDKLRQTAIDLPLVTFAS
jgi:hypothetical protein